MGVLHRPAADAPAQAAETGIVVVVGGPQYRAGSHRQFVNLARALAAAGHPVLRFDVRGMGDSTGAIQPFEQITPDVGAAIDALQQRASGVKHVVLWGLCDGASAALLYLHDRRDDRVYGLCLANPWVRSEVLQAKTLVRHYYWQRLRQPGFWRKLMLGGVGVGVVSEWGRSVAASAKRVASSPPLASYQGRMLSGWTSSKVPTLVLLSESDFTAREFCELLASDAAWASAMGRPNVTRLHLEGIDHTFSSSTARSLVERATRDWLFGISRGRVDECA
jgi:exosortase A-associated hydrolase 1